VKRLKYKLDSKEKNILEIWRSNGAIIGDNVEIHERCYIIGGPKEAKLISIGNNVILSTDIKLITHDSSLYNYSGIERFGKIIIEDNAFIGSGAVILPGVKIGKNSIIGAGSVVTSDIPENMVAAGNPAKIIASLDEFNTKIKNMMNNNDDRWYYPDKKKHKSYDEFIESIKNY